MGAGAGADEGLGRGIVTTGRKGTAARTREEVTRMAEAQRRVVRWPSRPTSSVQEACARACRVIEDEIEGNRAGYILES